jgi:hypothetical protein
MDVPLDLAVAGLEKRQRGKNRKKRRESAAVFWAIGARPCHRWWTADHGAPRPTPYAATVETTARLSDTGETRRRGQERKR